MMSAAGRFTQFGKLPTEIRLMVWEHHFQTPHVHIIRNFRGPVPEPEYAMFLYENTTNVPNKASIANVEADEVARLVEKRRTRVALGKDVTANELNILSTVLETGEYPEYRGFAATVFPASVNWDTDLIYLTPCGGTSPLSLAQDLFWTDKIQHLAFRLDMDQRNRSLLWRFQKHAEKRFASFAAIKELVLVIDPLRGSEGDWRQKPRDAYGFIPFDPECNDEIDPGDRWRIQQLVEIYRDTFSRLGRKVTLRTAIAVDEV